MSATKDGLRTEIARLQRMLDDRDELLSRIERLSRQRERFAESNRLPVIVDENMPSGVPWALVEMPTHVRGSLSSDGLPIPGITGSVPR